MQNTRLSKPGKVGQIFAPISIIKISYFCPFPVTTCPLAKLLLNDLKQDFSFFDKVKI
jgi:hypothetical protein